MASQCFEGVELDLVFISSGDSVYFDVNHPPDSSLKISLNRYLKAVPRASSIKFWLDLKNLNEENKLLAAAHLDKIIKSAQITPSHVIVESRNMGSLAPFLEKGFLSAYYLPMNLHQLDEAALYSKIEEISKGLSLHDNTYISAEYKDYNILNTYFPEQKKIIWFTLYGSMNKIEARFLAFKILRDPKVDVVLIPFSI